VYQFGGLEPILRILRWSPLSLSLLFKLYLAQFFPIVSLIFVVIIIRILLLISFFILLTPFNTKRDSYLTLYSFIFLRRVLFL
jgi:hypothetical protein